MPSFEAPCVELGSAPRTSSGVPSPSPSEISSASSPEPQNIRPTPLFRMLTIPPPEPEQPPGQEELERRLPGYRRIVIPRELTLIELLKQSSGVATDDEVLLIREARLRVMAERVGLRRLHVLAPRLRSLTLDGSALSSLRDLGIGLVHLKILSVNRCGLTSLDGVWGLSALREFHASGNRLQDLQPLAALQKLHTLNLADNPIQDCGRLWMLAVCGSLKKLTLKGTPASDEPDYRVGVASALPMLQFLDDRPLHTGFEDEYDDSFSSSDSEADVEPPVPDFQPQPTEQPKASTSQGDTLAEISKVSKNLEPLEDCKEHTRNLMRRRPATTENAGVRPNRVEIPRRPKTAQLPKVDAPTRLKILNTLMDEEWRCSGSKLTSHGAVCGNIAQALRRPASARRRGAEREAHRELIESSVEVVTRALAEEIPRAPRLDDWAKFKEETGIEIDIDFNQRPKGGDPMSAIERLERIERETKDRLDNNDERLDEYCFDHSRHGVISDYDQWKMENLATINDMSDDVDAIFNNIVVSAPEDLPD